LEVERQVSPAWRRAQWRRRQGLGGFLCNFFCVLGFSIRNLDICNHVLPRK
jgi:hypothetical protein